MVVLTVGRTTGAGATAARAAWIGPEEVESLDKAELLIGWTLLTSRGQRSAGVHFQ